MAKLDKAARPGNGAAWGVELGGSAVRVVRVSRAGGAWRVEARGSAPIDDRWDTAPDATTLLEELGIDDDNAPVVVCICDEHVLYRRLELPAADGATLEQMVAAQAEALLPLPREKLAVGWDHLLGDDARGGASDGGKPVLLAAARRERVDAIVDAAPLRGRDVTVVPSGVALVAGWRAFAARGDGPCALIDVAARHTTVALLGDQGMWQIGTLDEGSDHWTEAIAEVLDAAESDAEAIKLAVSDDDAAHDESQRPTAAALAAAQERWRHRLDHVYQSLLKTRDTSDRPQRVALLGNGSRARGLAQRVAESLHLSPITFEPRDGDIAPDALTAAGAALHALGAPDAPRPAVRLALPEARDVAPTATRWPWVKLALAAVWLLAALGAMGLLELRRADHLEARVVELRAAAAETSPLDEALAVGRHLDRGPVPPLVVLGELADVLPEQRVLSHWDYTREPTLRIRGEVQGLGELWTLLQDLSSSPLLTDVSLRDASVAGGRGRQQRWSFDITATPEPLFRVPLAARAAQANGDGEEP